MQKEADSRLSKGLVNRYDQVPMGSKRIHKVQEQLWEGGGQRRPRIMIKM